MKINKKEIKIDGSSYKIAIVLPYFNDKLGSELLSNTIESLVENQVIEENIKVVRVAGALEIPLACQKTIEKSNPDAVIALGIVIRGETNHFDLVCNYCYQGILDVQLKLSTPIAFGVLSCENLAQAKERVSKDLLNKGKDAAIAALIQLNI
jgi:6,7-dimethyl-8-ribityllumazine synthase